MKKIWQLWFISLFVKLVISALIPLSFDESYYWVWSENLSLSYFDHPPLIAWLFSLGTFLKPFAHTVRWPIVITGHLTLLIWVFILQKITDPQKIKAWISIALFSPLLGIGSMIGTPDVPLMFFWSLAIYFTIELFKSHEWKYYFLLGASLGLGFCSKYHMVIYVICLLSFIVFEKKYREIYLNKTLLSVFVGIIFSFPVWFWNYQNDFVSFKFQLAHGFKSDYFSFEWPVNYILGQLFIIFPTILWLSSKKPEHKNNNIFIYFAWIPLVFFFASSFKAPTEANWPIMALPSFFTLAVMRTDNLKRIYLHNVFWGVLYLIAFSSFFISPVNEKLLEPFKYKNWTHITEKYSPLYTSNYQSASSLWYLSKKPVYKLKEASRIDFYDFLPESTPPSSTFYYLKETENFFPEWLLPTLYKVTLIEKNNLFEIYKCERLNAL